MKVGERTLEYDLETILARNGDDFGTLRGTRMFITGGTGFVGSWLLESFIWANRRLALAARATVLTRDPHKFTRVAPHLANDPSITLLRGDVLDPTAAGGTFDVVIHAATPASAKINAERPFLMLDTIVEGTRRVLELAQKSGRIPVLFTSSGAVYGPQPPELALVDETYLGGPDSLDPRNAYHEAKRLAELSCVIAAKEQGILPKVARLFAFVGPYLPLDRHFAIGNFIRDAMAGNPIEIAGDGTPVRSYLYAADMASWLWRILVRGRPSRAYNVGSERTLTIGDTANLVAASVDPPVPCVVRGVGQGKPAERYACSTWRAREELDLSEWTTLEQAIQRTLAWHRATL